jgi:prepilin-type N-terminal cleavage/methylation domain-containing protein
MDCTLPRSRIPEVPIVTPTRKYQRGFSMIELMIGLVVFGILVGMSVPTFQHYSSSQQLRGSAENLVQTIQLQRSRAMATGNDVVINFNTAAPAAWTVMSGTRSSRTDLPNGVTYASAIPTSLTLKRDGRVNTSGTVVFKNRTGDSATVSVQLSGLALYR